MDTLISIIIPVYNVERYLDKCLTSIINQTFQAFEVIVVDDGSTDSTPQIADRYAAKQSNVTVVHKKNEGVSIARNTGIGLAKGKYYLFFDGDDFVEPYCLEELYQIVEDKKVDTIIYGYHRYEDGKIKETCYPIFEKEQYEDQEIRKELVPKFIGLSNESIQSWLRKENNALYVENPALWRSMVSAAVIKEQNLLFNKNLKVGEDTIFISEYLSYAKKCYVQQKCYYYLVLRDSSTISRYEKNPMGKLEGKIKLMEARMELTKKLKQNLHYDIESYWSGTVMMSCIEMAFLMAKKNSQYGFLKRYHLFSQYIKMPGVQRVIREFTIGTYGGIKRIPFILLKWRLYFLLYLCAAVLQIVHYEFQRN